MKGRKPRTRQMHFHFVGICGTGMGAAAAFLKQEGYRVTGSDQAVYPPMDHFLEHEGIEVTPRFDPSNLHPYPDVVVVGNAISRGNPEIEEVLNLKIPYVSLPELLKKELIRGKRSFVVSGTHGKTTSAALLAWVLHACGRDPSFFVGGIPANFGRGMKRGQGEEVVVEGDEYDSAFFDKRPKFVHYLPDLMIISSIEFDHADIYQQLSDIEKAFAMGTRLIPRLGRIVANADDSTVRQVAGACYCPVEWFGFGGEAAWRLSEVKMDGESLVFRLHHVRKTIERLRVPLMGEHNAMNAAAVYVACRWLGLSHQDIHTGFASFQGVRRRIEKRGTFRGVTVFDDFAHHPTAVRKTISAIKSHCPGRPVWAVFEPRSNTARRNLFQNELAHSFQGADQVIVGAVYNADAIDPRCRLDPIKLCRDIEADSLPAARYVPGVEDIVDFLSTHVRGGDIIVTMSNGGFGGLTDKLVKHLGG